MKRNVLFGTIFSAALAVGLSAQTGSGAQTGQQGSRNQNQGTQQVTVTGCLQDHNMTAGTSGTATGTTTGTSGTQANRGENRGAQFVLTNAEMTAGGAQAGRTTGGTTGTGGTGTSGTGTSGTSGTTAGAAGMETNNRFLLVGGNQQELRRYLNSRVEVRGRLDNENKGASNRTTGGGTATGTGQTGSGQTGSTAQGTRTGQDRMDDDTKRLRVTSVRQLAANCNDDKR
ncbi:MAG TPA: hypothetical protein VM364_19795 [Vicinamibacterales bacterium]|nr:hypothetical protein [Vicinamibacterales bacterium]